MRLWYYLESCLRIDTRARRKDYMLSAEREAALSDVVHM